MKRMQSVLAAFSAILFFAFGGIASVAFGEEPAPVLTEQEKPCLLKEKLVPMLREIIEKELKDMMVISGTQIPVDKSEELLQELIAGTLAKLSETRHIAESADDCPSGEWGKTLRP